MPGAATLRPRRSRSPREWAFRGGFAIVALALGYVSTSETLALVLSRSNPARAYAINDHDGRIGVRLAEQLVTSGNAGPAQFAHAERIARRALRDEPLSAGALTVLGLNAQRRGDTAAARALFARSDALSRRELGTRLWLIEDAVARGDIAGALRHYDIALRTSTRAPDLLYPVLASASADPRIARETVRVLEGRPAWSGMFVDYLATSGPDARSTARLFRALAQAHVPVPEVATANAVNALITAGAFDAAWNYYSALRKGADRRRSRDADFGAQVAVPTALDWTPVMLDAGVTASIQQSTTDGVFDFAAPATVGGVVLQQMQVLPPGRYRIEGRSVGIAQDDGQRPYWTLLCIDGRELGRVEVPNSSQAEGRFFGELTVGAGCPAQTLRLVVRPSNAIGGVSGQIDRVELRPS